MIKMILTGVEHPRILSLYATIHPNIGISFQSLSSLRRLRIFWQGSDAGRLVRCIRIMINLSLTPHSMPTPQYLFFKSQNWILSCSILSFLANRLMVWPYQNRFSCCVIASCVLLCNLRCDSCADLVISCKSHSLWGDGDDSYAAWMSESSFNV